LSAFNIEWKVWDDTKKKKNSIENPKVVGGTDLSTKKIYFLKRVIGEYLHGKDYVYSLLNGDYFDLRNSNIYPFKNGTGHSDQVRKEKQALLETQSPLQKKNDIDITANNDDVKVIEYEERLLLVKNDKVVNELSFAEAVAVTNYFSTLNQ
ncbi:hypothetical protein, partial [Exiguobacterium sp. B2(2022)]